MDICTKGHRYRDAVGKEIDVLLNAHNALRYEIREMQNQIPTLIRIIRGKYSDSIVAGLQRHRTQAARRLLSEWQDAEQRLIAVANSLSNVQAGQKVMAVGIPLLAAHLMGSPLQSQCYTTESAIVPRMHKPVASINLPLGKVTEHLDRILEKTRKEISLLQRGAFLFFLFLPLALTSPVCLLGNTHCKYWLDLLRWTLEKAGPAFIKWGQWAATRPDLFPQDFCTTLEALQTSAPQHDYAATKVSLEMAYGIPIEKLFIEFDPKPVASGSIAQVHRAKLSEFGAFLCGGKSNIKMESFSNPFVNTKTGILPLSLSRGRRERRQRATFVEGSEVAVKVRHPGVTDLMEKDFVLMNRAAAILSFVPGLSLGPQLKESLMQFGAPMREQLDLRAEAEHLAKFADNFRWWSGVRFPLPASSCMIASNVLIESFEEGEHISEYLGRKCPHNKILAGLGVNCYLKMLLRDNYIHADLHPGNILVRLEGPTPGSLVSWITYNLGLEAPKLPRLVLLDVGMTAKLTNDDKHNLVGFFKGLTSLDGAAVADAILKFAEPLDEKSPGALWSELTKYGDTISGLVRSRIKVLDDVFRSSDQENEGDSSEIRLHYRNGGSDSQTDSSNDLSSMKPANVSQNKVVSDLTGEDMLTARNSSTSTAKFRADMAALFSQLDPDTMRHNTADVMAEMMDTIRRHGVHIRGVVSTVVITSMILEGWSSKLDPDIRVLETVRKVLPSAWNERMSIAMDRVLKSNSFALV